MSARIKHQLLTRDRVRITVLPGPGRYPEPFVLDRAELRRFAWALLSDLDPAEALAAAGEEGVPLSVLAGPVVDMRLAPGDAPPPRPPSGSKKWRLLQAMAGGASTLPALQAAVPDCASPTALLHELHRDGYIARTPGWRGQVARYTLTNPGADVVGVALAAGDEPDLREAG